jgi:hypothetical protein
VVACDRVRHCSRYITPNLVAGKSIGSVSGVPYGLREPKWFAKEAEANAEVKKRNSEMTDHGSKAYTMTASERHQAEEAIQLLSLELLE